MLGYNDTCALGAAARGLQKDAAGPLNRVHLTSKQSPLHGQGRNKRLHAGTRARSGGRTCCLMATSLHAVKNSSLLSFPFGSTTSESTQMSVRSPLVGTAECGDRQHQ